MALLPLLVVGSTNVAAQRSQPDPFESWRDGFPGTRTTEQQVNALGVERSGTGAAASHRQRLFVRTIRPQDAPAGVYFYVERAALERLQQPLLQEVWRVTSVSARIVVERFTLKVPARFLGIRSSDAMSATLALDDLAPATGCDMRFAERDGDWEGETSGKSCPSSVPGATGMRTRVRWNQQRLTLEERHLDARDREVAGPPLGVAYEFTLEVPLEATR